jgi:hypothetical protein
VPALVYQGTADEWTTVELAQRFATDYRNAGGTVDVQLLPGERHTFVNEHPFSINSVKAVEMSKAFIKKYGAPKLLRTDCGDAWIRCCSPDCAEMLGGSPYQRCRGSGPCAASSYIVLDRADRSA